MAKKQMMPNGLQELKAAGITKIMGINTQWIGTENVNAWLDRVYSYGIRVIIDLRDWDGTTVPDYANHPGLIGFLMTKLFMYLF